MRSEISPPEHSRLLTVQQQIFNSLSAEENHEAALERLCHLIETQIPQSIVLIELFSPPAGKNGLIRSPSVSDEFSQYFLEPEHFSPGAAEAAGAVGKRCWKMPIRSEGKGHVGNLILVLRKRTSPAPFYKRLCEIGAFAVAIVLQRSGYEEKIDQNRRELEILALAIKHASDSIVVTDRHNRIIKTNHAFSQMFGYDEAEVHGERPDILSSITQESHLFLEIWETVLRTKHWNGEMWNKRKNGELFPAWVRISAITGDTNKIENYLAVFTDLSELRSSQKKSLKLAYYDQLTGLPNRQKIVADMQKRNPTACIIFNIDDFKEINDFFGIETGDAILKQIGEWFETMNFSPYRIGGDEFAVLFHDAIQWNDLRNRIHALISMLEDKIFTIDEEMITIRMTVGAAIGDNKLLTRADIALNDAKKEKKSIALYAEEGNVEETYRANLRMSAAIRLALANRRIVCHYQPIVDVNTGEIDKYETLVRMIDAEGNMVYPGAFLTVAKKTKLYPHITVEVVKQACTLFGTRREEFSINLSDSDIRDPRIVREILNTIEKTGTGERIVFEILESEGIENYEEVVAFIRQVKALGARIAIDDFGTGYSNFENILKLNVDYLKIDGSLIQGIENNPRHRIVVETIADFAHRIHARTIAEFVGSEATYAILKEIGIDYAQGFYTGKPGALTCELQL